MISGSMDQVGKGFWRCRHDFLRLVFKDRGLRLLHISLCVWGLVRCCQGKSVGTVPVATRTGQTA